MVGFFFALPVPIFLEVILRSKSRFFNLKMTSGQEKNMVFANVGKQGTRVCPGQGVIVRLTCGYTWSYHVSLASKTLDFGSRVLAEVNSDDFLLCSFDNLKLVNVIHWQKPSQHQKRPLNRQIGVYLGVATITWTLKCVYTPFLFDHLPILMETSYFESGLLLGILFSRVFYQYSRV